METETQCCGGTCGCNSGLVEFEPLPDLSNVSMAALLDGAGGVPLQRSAKRLVASLDDPNGVISSFSSFVE